jgi:hypothetical protein
MSTGLLVSLELILVVGVVLGWAIWELVSLKRDDRRKRRRDRDDSAN